MKLNEIRKLDAFILYFWNVLFMKVIDNNVTNQLFLVHRENEAMRVSIILITVTALLVISIRYNDS